LKVREPFHPQASVIVRSFAGEAARPTFPVTGKPLYGGALYSVDTLVVFCKIVFENTLM